MSELFSYHVDENDTSASMIREQEEFYGLDRAEPQKYSEKYLELSNEILQHQEIMRSYDFPLTDFSSKFVSQSTEIWNQLGIKLQDVQFIKKSYDIEHKLKEKIDQEFIDSLEINSPFQIPVRYDNNIQNTKVESIYLKMKEQRCVLFRSIILPRIEKRITSSIYAHETTHVELYNAGGGVRSYFNKETLPIFMEEIFADILGVLELSQDNRLSTMAIGIQKLAHHPEIIYKLRIDMETYMISIIQGLHLSKVYLSASEKVKKEMIQDINRIFSGHLLTEDMLKKYDSLFEEIDPKVKKIRYCQK